MDRNVGRVIVAWIIAALVIVIVGAIIALGFGLIEGPINDLHWKAFEHSTVNIQGLQTELTQKMEDYAKIDTNIALYEGNEDVVKGYCAQQRALLGMFYVAYDKLSTANKGSIPQAVNEFAAAHLRNSSNPACPQY